MMIPAVTGVIALLFIVVGGYAPFVGFLQGTALHPVLYKMHMWSHILSGVGVGILSGLVVWVAAVYLPQLKKRRILRASMAYRYRTFRETLLKNFLAMSKGGYMIGEPEALQDPEKFRKFFDTNRWGVVQENLSENKYHLREVLNEFELLYQEAVYVRSNCDFQDEKVHLFLERLSATIARVKNPAPHDSEELGDLLWFARTMFTQWNHVDGDLGEDVIQKMIDTI